MENEFEFKNVKEKNQVEAVQGAGVFDDENYKNTDAFRSENYENKSLLDNEDNCKNEMHSEEFLNIEDKQILDKSENFMSKNVTENSTEQLLSFCETENQKQQNEEQKNVCQPLPYFENKNFNKKSAEQSFQQENRLNIKKEVITSLDNPTIKLARSLLQRKNRKFYGAFLVEGENLVKEAILSARGLEKVFVETSYVEKYKELLMHAGCEIIVVSAKVLESLCETITPQGIVAQVEMMPSLNFRPTKPFLVLDCLQDPGNMGTIIRSAVATGTPDIVLLNTVDVFNPKVVRSSVGTLFHANFYPLEAEELVALCEKYRFQLVVTEMFGNNIFDDPPIDDHYALVIGNEGHGVSEYLLAHKDLSIALPMDKRVESLNAGVSASVILYILKGKNINKGE